MTPPDIPPPGVATEPLITVGAITSAVTAALALVVAFGLRLTADQTAAILGVFAVAAPVIVATWGRAKVYAPATVRRMVRQAEGKDPIL